MANLRKQVDMPHCIARLIALTLGLLLPTQGRHRHLGEGAPVAASPQTPAPRAVSLLRGEDSPLVRPYLLAPDEFRLQRQRRRALWLATHGIDTGPRRIHGVKVAA
ncbi:MAG TPA: hypothetical protein VN520_02205 [Streptomyces sp.]|uniref:hypothetical protein n=1 Tax=Streptomyces sp. TaxID=1931 RepID=UPI002C8F4ED0|nr:hypothetical protein [Streptomyces sp.]HWU05216.1 hypothetical protein [Streptomyces sp.]